MTTTLIDVEAETVPAYVANPRLRDWVAEMAALCTPDAIRSTLR